jgi:ATP-dependent RNA helicase DeaD
MRLDRMFLKESKLMRFNELGLNPNILKSIEALGFETPTPIQEQAIPLLLKAEQDFIGLAQTGTGKTAAFGLPLLERVDAEKRIPQGIILCPTRELCLQIADDLVKFSTYTQGVQVVAVYGGSAIVTQIRQLKQGAQIVVATPGRLLDLIERRAIQLSDINTVVLDEADEMLNMGFKEELDGILSKMPEERMTWLFSATMAKGVARIAETYLTNPVEVSVGGKNESAKNIEHRYFMVHERDRYQALKRLLDFLPSIYGLVFCRTRAETQQVAEKLMQDGYQAEALHGDLSQSQRDYVMRKFRQKTIRVLVATDVAARGIDVNDITHVIHYKLSDEAATYTHRSGRTARAGKSGASLALVNMNERGKIADLERRNNIKIERTEIPDGRSICESQLVAMIEKVVSCDVNEEEIKDYLPHAFEALCELDKKEIIKRFVATEFNHFLEYYRHAGDINVRPRGRDEQGRPPVQRSENRKRNDQLEAYSTKRFSINMGRVNKINAGAIVRLICENCGIPSNAIGEIDLGREQSFFEVNKEAVPQVRDGMQNVSLDGRKVSIRAASSGDRENNGGGQGQGRKGGRQGRPGRRRA